MKKEVEPDLAKEFNKSSTAMAIFFKATLLSIFFAFAMLVITGMAVGLWGLNKLNTFAKTADTSISELKNTVALGLTTPVTHSDYKKNILLLGIDSLETRPGSPALTDTMIIMSVDLKSGKISTVPLPRDLWNSDYQTRINALYFYGQERYPETPQKFAQEVVSEMTGVNIHHTLVISMDSVASIIDMLGGIEVDVEHGFTDEEFPRPDVDITQVTNPELLYQTITFEEGLQTMDGEKALQFIRSRKSENEEGDDIARSNRQQLVINSLIQKLENFDYIGNVETAAKLYKYYLENYANQISIEELIATGQAMYRALDQISYSSNSISIYPEDELGVITNPPTYQYKGEWVYEIRNQELFEAEILSKLEIQE